MKSLLPSAKNLSSHEEIFPLPNSIKAEHIKGADDI